jgi:asparagine synthase (glutamine-hydrolysing)
VAFSGGVDSGIVAHVVKKFSPGAVLLTVGVKNSADLIRAQKIAKKMNMKWVKKIISEKEIRQKYVQAKKILKLRKTDHLQQTLGVVNLCIAELAQREKISTLFVGSGADELFCGYAAFEKVRNSDSECEKLRKEKVKNVFEHDVKREVTCGKAFGVQVVAPFLDEKMSMEALKVPAHANLTGKYGKIRKNVLRMLGEKMGVLKEVVNEPKKAMQYGSGVSKQTAKRASEN